MMLAYNPQFNAVFRGQAIGMIAAPSHFVQLAVLSLLARV